MVTLLIVITVAMEDFLTAAMPKIPTLAGLKFTSYDMFDLGRCLVLNKNRIQILYGGDEVSKQQTRAWVPCLLC